MPASSGTDLEEQSLALLYRKAKTFAVGHGCAANWEPMVNTSQEQVIEEASCLTSEETERVAWVSGECFPSVEIPTITPDVRRKDGSKVEVEMAQLAGLVPNDDGFAGLLEIVSLYEKWIENRECTQDIQIVSGSRRKT